MLALHAPVISYECSSDFLWMETTGANTLEAIVQYQRGNFHVTSSYT